MNTVITELGLLTGPVWWNHITRWSSEETQTQLMGIFMCVCVCVYALTY